MNLAFAVACQVLQPQAISDDLSQEADNVTPCTPAVSVAAATAEATQACCCSCTVSQRSSDDEVVTAAPSTSSTSEPASGAEVSNYGTPSSATHHVRRRWACPPAAPVSFRGMQPAEEEAEQQGEDEEACSTSSSTPLAHRARWHRATLASDSSPLQQLRSGELEACGRKRWFPSTATTPLSGPRRMTIDGSAPAQQVQRLEQRTQAAKEARRRSCSPTVGAKPVTSKGEQAARPAWR